MTPPFSEVSFFKAEAALLGWGAQSTAAESFFKVGAAAALQLPPYAINIIPTAYDTNVLSFAGLTDAQKLDRIMTQKWLHLFGRNYEAFAEWRRNRLPAIIPGSSFGSTNGQIT